ncbi:MAG: O-antigen ligase family protein [Acidobacteria bacterium]|nr:O-antigen ligase family protein [Acidobacteriota bacterium]
MAPAGKFFLESRPTRPEKEVGFLGDLVAIGLLAGQFFTALAFGAVEAWSIAVFGFLIVCLLFAWVVKGAIDRSVNLVLPHLAFPLTALFIFGFWQSFYKVDATGKQFSVSMDVEATRLCLEILLVLIFAFLIFANFFTSSKRLLWFRNFLILLGLGLSIFGLIQKFTWNGKYYWVIQPSTPTPSPFGSFVNHNHFAGFVEMIVPIPVAMIVVRVVQKEIAIFYGFAAGMMGLAIVVSLSRWGMVSFAASLIFVVLMSLKIAIRRVKRMGGGVWRLVILPRIGALALIALTIGLGVSWIGAGEVLDRLAQTEIQSDLRESSAEKGGFLESRGPIWRDTLAMIRENWLTGVGLGAFETAYPIYSKSSGSVIISQAHNDYLQILADCGVIGGVIAIWFVVVLFRNLVGAIQHQDEVKAVMALGCGGGLVAMLVHSLFDFNLQIPSNALLFLTLAGVVTNIQASVRRTKEHLV